MDAAISDLDTLLITRSEVKALLDIQECMAAVEQAFRLHAEGKILPPKILGFHAKDGRFHIKTGLMQLGRNYFVAKLNANFPGNRVNNGFPTIQGVVAVCDAINGRLLALMDSIEITILRTGAATGVAARYLSRENSRIATVCGCGNQGRISLDAILTIRKLETIYIHDIDESQMRLFADEVSKEYDIDVIPVDDVGLAVSKSDICVTCTPSRKPFIKKSFVKPGTFIAAVGSDSEDKQELETALIASSKLVVDLVEQCAVIGELHHAIHDGTITLSHVHGQLGEVIAGIKTGRESKEEIIIFDSTGTALQDVAAAAIVYEKAVTSPVKRLFAFSK